MVYDDELGDEDSGAQPEKYLLDEVELHVVASLCELIRSRVSTMAPSCLRSAADLLLALERLPVATPDVHVMFTFSQPNNDGSWGWADGEITEYSF